MSETKVKISELPSSGNDTAGLCTIGVDGQGRSVKVPLGEILSQTAPLAQSAKTAALEAKGIAQTASETASDALAKSNTAKTDAAEAKTNAATALGRSVEAKTAAENAESSAEAAQEAAEDAARSAQTAQNAVNNATGAITPRLFINADTVLGIRTRRLDTVIELLENRNDIGTFRVKGVVLTFTGVNGLESWQWSGQNWSNPQNWMPYRYTMQKLDNEEQMDAMRANGTADPTVIYYTEEE